MWPAGSRRGSPKRWAEMVGPVIRVLRAEGADRDLPLPSYATPGAAGADLRADLPEDERAGGRIVEPRGRTLVPTGLILELPSGYEGQVRPRSGLAVRHGLTVLNAPGTIDADYRGEVAVALVNLGAKEVRIAHGDRIAQLVIAPVVRADFLPAESLGETLRGSGGFGSTGTG